eukprot:TRINITY_DN45151_c0_g1_i1.p1 TRINITY_DN45151_c0_g1~~TRINITY_DN45151_c0_g1_i1.p1  ORF type:complete len:147 (+),score=32.79 TRINITY_DN45151_c0_g1_i1:165-605(+)
MCIRDRWELVPNDEQVLGVSIAVEKFWRLGGGRRALGRSELSQILEQCAGDMTSISRNFLVEKAVTEATCSPDGVNLGDFCKLIWRDPWVKLLGLSGEETRELEETMASEDEDGRVRREEWMECELGRLECTWLRHVRANLCEVIL